ncbi:MAG: hypothetical protein AB1Z23_11140 [Eubacteriales bacterium]
MADVRFEKLAKENKMLYSQDSIYGIKSRYHVCTNYKNDGIKETFSIRFSLINLTDEDRQKIVDYVNEKRDTLKLSSVDFNQNLVTIAFGVVPTKNNMFANALQDITLFFARNGFVSGCSVSQTDKNIKFIPYRGQVIALAPEVYNKINKEDMAVLIKNDQGGYLSGAIGAVIGGVAGIIPWVLFGSLGRITTLSGFLMSILAKFGYDKANGRQGQKQFSIIIIVTIIFTYIGIIASETFKVVRDLMAQGYQLAQISVSKAFSLMAAFPFTAEGVGSGIWRIILLSYLFTAAGSAIFLYKVHQGLGEETGDTLIYSVPQPSIQ